MSEDFSAFKTFDLIEYNYTAPNLIIRYQISQTIIQASA